MHLQVTFLSVQDSHLIAKFKNMTDTNCAESQGNNFSVVFARPNVAMPCGVIIKDMNRFFHDPSYLVMKNQSSLNHAGTADKLKCGGKMLKRASKNLIMASLFACLVFGVSACSKKSSSQDTGMDQNDQTTQTSEAKPASDMPSTSAGSALGEDIHFDFDSSAITSSSAENLRGKAKVLSDKPDMEVTIEGHCDDRGTNEYNMALGDRRAQSAKDFLVQLGIDANRLNTVSYGEERPLIPNAKNEAEHAKNRRAAVISGSIAASTGYAQPPDVIGGPSNSYHYSKIDTLPFVRTNEIESYGKIFAKRDEDAVLIDENEEVYILPEEGKKLILGNQYMIYTNLKPLKNKDGDIIGIPHRVNGVVEIVKLEKTHAVGKVVKSYWEFKEGNKIAPYKKKSPDIAYAPTPKGISGDIIMGAFDDVAFAQNQIVFLDKGKNQNVKIGQKYNIYRDLVVPPSAASSETTTSPIDLGKLLILDAGEDASSAIILHSEKDFYPWSKYRSPN